MVASCGRPFEQAAGFGAQLSDIEAVPASSREQLHPVGRKALLARPGNGFAFTRVVELEATSQIAASSTPLNTRWRARTLIRDLMPDHRDGVRVERSFASEQ